MRVNRFVLGDILYRLIRLSSIKMEFFVMSSLPVLAKTGKRKERPLAKLVKLH